MWFCGSVMNYSFRGKMATALHKHFAWSLIRNDTDVFDSVFVILWKPSHPLYWHCTLDSNAGYLTHLFVSRLKYLRDFQDTDVSAFQQEATNALHQQYWWIPLELSADIQNQPKDEV